MFHEDAALQCLASQYAGLYQGFSGKKKKTTRILEQRMALHKRFAENFGNLHKIVVEVKQEYEQNDRLILFGQPCIDEKYKEKLDLLEHQCQLLDLESSLSDTSDLYLRARSSSGGESSPGDFLEWKQMTAYYSSIQKPH